MFKINKLKDATDEKVVINSSKQEVYKVGNGVIDYNLLLDFNITGEIGNEEYIIPVFQPACRSLWDKNVETFMASNNDEKLMLI